MVRDYLRGDTLEQAAGKHGLTTKACRNALKAAGVPSRPLSAYSFRLSVAQVRRLSHKEGLPDGEIGRRFGVSGNTVCRLRKRLGIITKVGTGRPKLPRCAPTRKWFLNVWLKERASRERIAEILGITAGAVDRWREFLRIPNRRKRADSPRRRLDKQTLEHDYLVAKMTCAEIAAKHGVSHGAVPNWLRHYGIPLRVKPRTIPLPGPRVLRRLHLKQNLSVADIAEMYAAYSRVICKIMHRHGIPVIRSGWRICNDGDRVRSHYEQKVDDWLFANGIPHVYDQQLPFGTRHRADFKIGSAYVEIWGVQNSAPYAKTKKLKKDLYKKHNATLVEISWHHFYGKKKWTKILESAFAS